MESLTKQSEQAVLAALRSVCREVDSGGLAPTEALHKVAQAEQLGPHFIRLVATGYNSGATTYQRENGQSILDKLATFPLADPEAVIRQLYPEKVASPGEEKLATAVSAEYGRAPRTSGRPTIPGLREKVASVVLPKPPPAAETVDAKLARASAQISRGQQAKEAARYQAAQAQEQLLSALGQAGDYFRQWPADRWPLAEVEWAAASRWGKSAQHVLDYIYDRNAMREKRASSAPPPARPIPWDQPPFTLIEACVKLARAVVDRRDEYDRLSAQYDQQAEELLRPFAPSPAAPSAAGGSILSPSAAKEASFLGGLLGTALSRNMMSMPAAKTPAQLSDSMVNKLSDPEHENELRQIRAQTLLNDLLSNDDVISGYDPQEVFDAYNEIADAMPIAATHTAMMRPLLRKRLTQGALEPFEAAEMANIEKTLSQTRTQSQPTGKEAGANVLRKRSILA